MSLVTPRKGYKSVPWLFGKEIEIPQEWEVLKIKDILDFTSGIIFNIFCEEKDGIRIITLYNIDVKGNFRYTVKDKFVSKFTYKKLPNSQLKKNDLLIIMTDVNPKLNLMGKVGIVNIDDDLVLNQRVARLRSRSKNSHEINIHFIRYFLNSDHIRKQITIKANGTAQFNISNSTIKETKIFLPEIKIQDKITNILLNIDSLIESTEKVISHSKKVKTGLMQKLLTRGIGHTKFKKVPWLFGKEIEIPEEWEVQYLEQVTNKILDGEHISPSFLDFGIPYLSAQHIKSKILFDNCKYVNNKTYEKIIKRIHSEYDDILITVKGTIGFIKRIDIDKKFCMDRNVGLIKPIKEKLESIFLENFMRSILVQKQILGLRDNNVIPSLYLNRIKKIKIITPSLPEQQKIASILSNIDSKITSQEQYKEKLEKLKKSLMQKLLTGEVRV